MVTPHQLYKCIYNNNINNNNTHTQTLIHDSKFRNLLYGYQLIGITKMKILTYSEIAEASEGVRRRLGLPPRRCPDVTEEVDVVLCLPPFPERGPTIIKHHSI